MFTAEGHEEVKAYGGAREPHATNKHNNWKASMAAYEGQHAHDEEQAEKKKD
ncbi:hypothetical protein IJ096_03365 [Candidatus Saccharibacteria bacterium]|nr:hypothetical protein [Candidatus Saccharibacteria bacterium]